MKSLFSLLFLLPLFLLAQEVIFASENNSRGRDLYSLNIENNKVQKLTTNLGNGHYPHFNNPKLSPDGTKLVFQSDPDGHDRYTIWSMNIDGTNLKKITQKEGMYPNWSPDGSTIIFSGRRNGTWEILSIPASGGPEQIISNNKKNGKNPGWGATCSFHPDGRSIVYSYIREKMLYSYNFETKETERMSVQGSYTHPVYSTDGTIAVNRKIDQGYDLIVIKDGKEEVITKSIVSYSAPDWYANNTKLLFTGMMDGNQELFSIDLQTKEEIQLTKNKAFDAMPISH